jgi:hypothetical protein
MAVKIKIILDIQKKKQTIIAITQIFMQFSAMILKISDEILPPHLNLVL